MKELEVFLKSVAEGLKLMAQGVETLAEKVDALARSEEESKAEDSATPTPNARSEPIEAAASAKTAAKRPRQKPAQGTAIGTVFEIITRSRKGVHTSEIKEKTGFGDKKIHNIIYKLKKQGRIKSERKGVYVKTR